MLRKGETVGDYTTNPSTRTGKPKTSSKQADEVAPSVVYNVSLCDSQQVVGLRVPLTLVTVRAGRARGTSAGSNLL